jgi:phosphodiesterase/alkaline phosphatase D-like protein
MATIFIGIRIRRSTSRGRWRITSSKYWWGKFGTLDHGMPFLGTRNEDVLKAIADYQITGLYGTKLRSLPSFFLTDDHDEFENDEFTSTLATMPASEFGLDGEDATQFMYYPEFLPDAGRPDYLWGTKKIGRAPRTNQFYGTLRYGDLLEAVFYDCRRFADYKGIHARLVPRWTEDWLIRRTLAQDTAQLVHVPSLPFAYTSGKLGDWYPDLLGPQGHVILYEPKPGWQDGWFGQHQRLIAALGKQTQRSAVIVEGDFHSSAAGKMTRVADVNLAGNPVNVVLAGTLGTGDYGFPSQIRAVESSPSELVTMDEALRVTEKNGFTIIDVTPDKMTFRMFMWRPPEPVAAIDNLQPALVYETKRPS